MKHLFSMIGIGVCAVLFTACATEPSDADDTGQEAALSTAAPDISILPADSTAISASPLSPGTPCNAFTITQGGSCPSSFTCLWQNDNFAGQIVGVSRGCVLLDLRQVSCPGCKSGNFNDAMSSWENNSGAQSCWWTNINRGGTEVVMPDGVSHASTAAGNNDKASSFGSC